MTCQGALGLAGRGLGVAAAQQQSPNRAGAVASGAGDVRRIQPKCLGQSNSSKRNLECQEPISDLTQTNPEGSGKRSPQGGGGQQTGLSPVLAGRCLLRAEQTQDVQTSPLMQRSWA